MYSISFWVTLGKGVGSAKIVFIGSLVVGIVLSEQLRKGEGISVSAP